MNILIDTHVFIWSATQKTLSPRATQMFLDPENQLFFSAVSYWEIAIKVSINKLDLADNWAQLIDDVMLANEILWLPIEKAHCQGVTRLPTLHNDPFDRLLVAQAISEGLTLMTADANIRRYAIPTLW